MQLLCIHFQVILVTDSKRLVLTRLDNDSTDVGNLVFCILDTVAAVFPAAVRLAFYVWSYPFLSLLQT